MPLRLAILGLDPIQSDWTAALRALAADSAILPVAAAHLRIAAARDLADLFAIPAYDDLRKLLVDTAPQIILLDRPTALPLDFLTTCISQNIALFSLGPPVFSVPEARTLAEFLEPRTHLLGIYPRFASAPAFRHCTQAEEYLGSPKFAAAQWYAPHHALAKSIGNSDSAVRSLSVLAWDALGTLIELLGPPEAVFAAFRGTMPSPGSFADLSGSASFTLRFADSTPASLALSDQLLPAQRNLLLHGAQGTLRLSEDHYHFTKPGGQLIDEGSLPRPTGPQAAASALHNFITQFLAPPSPLRGTLHRLEHIASTLEAALVSHRTGQAESPERFLSLRR